MKILHVISQPPDFTGSGKFISQIISQSRRQGHDNFLVAGVQSDFKIVSSLISPSQCLFVRFEGDDVSFPIPGMSDIMPYKSRRFSTLTQEEISSYKKAFKLKISDAIKQFSPDVIHTHHLWMVTALVSSLAGKIPVVTTCHGTCLRQHYLCPDMGTSIQKNLQKINQVIALSQAQKQQIIKTIGIESNKIQVISGGYNQACFFYTPKVFDGTVHILYAGKLSTSKGVPWLLKSLEKIQHLPFVLHLAGTSTGPEKEHCHALARRLGHKAVFHGALSHEKLGDLMRKSHIFVLPSFYEGMPLVLMEAAACGCRIVATDLDGVKEIFGSDHNPMVDLVALPKLKTIDAPFEKDMEMLTKTLSTRLEMTIQSVVDKNVPDMAQVCSASSQYTWETVFLKIQTVYQKVYQKTLK